MLFAAAAAGGTVATYLFDPRAPGYARLATGVIVGLTMLAFGGFVAAMLLGMGPAALLIAAGANTLLKCAMAIAVAGRALARWVALTAAATLVAGLAGLWLSGVLAAGPGH